MTVRPPALTVNDSPKVESLTTTAGSAASILSYVLNILGVFGILGAVIIFLLFKNYFVHYI
ncbi:hypothetical protein [Candidatus Tisiphia endosymbiont of Ceraclea dissimilis]|uniref:hypothetical protein n=1 Tax=Candidatus Tisiphia endosymbiont of Ceraclea dissimilis TaxID=3077928 RepID=UPI003CCAEB54